MEKCLTDFILTIDDLNKKLDGFEDLLFNLDGELYTYGEIKLKKRKGRKILEVEIYPNYNEVKQI